jgi:hypothetical protein
MTEKLERNPDGTFPEGKSGNPKGRPLGSKNKITLLKQSLELQLREQAESRMPAVLEKAIELALDGDRAMLKLLLEQHLSKGASDESGKAAERPQINITGVSKVEVSSPASSPASTDVADGAPSSSSLLT